MLCNWIINVLNHCFESLQTLNTSKLLTGKGKIEICCFSSCKPNDTEAKYAFT